MKNFALISSDAGENPFFKPREAAICKYTNISIVNFLASLTSYRKMSKYGTACPDYPLHGMNHVNPDWLCVERDSDPDDGNGTLLWILLLTYQI